MVSIGEGAVVLVPSLAVRVKEVLSLELVTDLRLRRLRARLILLAVVLEFLEESLSEELELDESLELDEFKISARIPGC